MDEPLRPIGKLKPEESKPDVIETKAPEPIKKPKKSWRRKMLDGNFIYRSTYFAIRNTLIFMGIAAVLFILLFLTRNG